jgi:hypothetical protein
MPNIQPTYSEPTVTRSVAESVIEFDIHAARHPAWESFLIRREDDGQITIDCRGEGPVRIPAQILPLVLAEIDRVVSGDAEMPLAPFAPLAAVEHVTLDGVA